jgi:CRISPR-associated protein Cmr2
MSFEIINENLEYIKDHPIQFLKWGAKYNNQDGRKVKDMNNKGFIEAFPFATDSDKRNKKLKNLKNTEFALEWFKQRKVKINNKVYAIPNEEVIGYSGILREDSLKTKVEKLIPFSFILHAKIRLKSPYFSHDDDEFYVIQNPILKEKVFKVPMNRGSGWKGAIAKAGKELVLEDLKKFNSYARIFGIGSSDYRNLIDALSKDKNIKNKLISFALFELGLKLNKEDIDQINKEPKTFLEKLSSNLTPKNTRNKDISYLQPHKGRTIFYPTYFDKLSLEVINPHSRKTRAGTNPIYYEIVPKCTKGILQIVYIPYDGILLSDEKLKEQVKEDIKYLTECINKTAGLGIGAKTELGWGQFEFEKKEYSINGEIGNLETDWERYEEKKQ